MRKGPVAEGSAGSAEPAAVLVAEPSPGARPEPSEDGGLEMPGLTWGCLF